MLDLMDDLISRRVIPYVIAPKTGVLIDELEKRNIKYSVYPYDWWVGKEVGFFKRCELACKAYSAALKIAKDIIGWGIDIVHTNSSVIHTGALAAKLAKVHHVWHIRELIHEHYNLDYFLGFKKAVKYMNKTSDKIICISDIVRESYKEYLPEHKLVRIYDGVPKLPHFPKTPQNNVVTFLLVGLLFPSKGQKEAILATGKLVKNGIKNIKLILAGDGDYETELRIIVEKEKLTEYVTLTGYIEDLSSYRNNSDVALVCSKFEAFGLATVEAMLSHLPVIAADSGANAEIVIPGETGLLYEPGNIDDLAKKMEFLVKSFDKRIELGENGYRRAKANFTIEKNGISILDIYSQVLKIG